MATVDEVIHWLERQGEAHFGSNARLYRTAVSRFSEQRLEGEPNSADWVADNLDALAERLAKADHINGGSLKTYMSRARSALASYEDWARNPIGWTPKGRKPDPDRKRRAPSSSKDRPEEQPSPGTPTTDKGDYEPASLDDEISRALVAIANWPRLRPYLMVGLSEAMDAARKEKGGS